MWISLGSVGKRRSPDLGAATRRAQRHSEDMAVPRGRTPRASEPRFQADQRRRGSPAGSSRQLPSRGPGFDGAPRPKQPREAL
jgi:hypothetical protein